MKRAQTGFTLIEILAAVAVLAIAMSAILGAMARYAGHAAHLREKTVALWVAHNRLTEIELERSFPGAGKSDGDVEMAGMKWEWAAEVTETPDQDVRRVDVRVRRKDAGGDGHLAELSAFISASGRK